MNILINVGQSLGRFNRQKAKDMALILIKMIGDFITSDDSNLWSSGGHLLKIAGPNLESAASEIYKDGEVKSALDKLMSEVEARSGPRKDNPHSDIQFMMADIVKTR